MGESEQERRLAALDAMTDWDLGGGEAAAVVDCGSLVALAPGVSDQHRKDVLLSFLLAQLVANKKYNRHTDPVRWYEFYGETLERVGWVVKEHEGFSRHRPRKVPYRAGPLVLRTLGRVSDGNTVNLAGAAVRALAELDPGDRAAELFEDQAHFERAGNFQLAVAEEVAEQVAEQGEGTVGADVGGAGLVVLRLGRFRCRAVDEATELGRLFHTDFRAADEFIGGAQVLHLNEDVYGPLRDGIAEKLGARVEVLIAPVGGVR
ncbi:hypothetical protein ABZV77_08775 [Streptomyces sp. NPDC004732]|uniref:hypothetical protein n=1 Tax=Streptomyces sp. NPDC004732 TaxID=3154290 RepID=UPI0033B55133